MLAPQATLHLPDGISKPIYRTLSAGTVLFRVHKCYRSALSFNNSVSSSGSGGRFDGTSEDPYPYYYAALTAHTALFEAILAESTPAGQLTARIPRNAVEHRVLSAVRLTRDVDLISLTSEQNLAAAGQSTWLVTAEREHFHETRQRARHLRSLCPSAHGLVWQSRREPGDGALVLFGDRCDPSYLRSVPGGTCRLDDNSGATLLRTILNAN